MNTIWIKIRVLNNYYFLNFGTIYVCDIQLNKDFVFFRGGYTFTPLG